MQGCIHVGLQDKKSFKHEGSKISKDSSVNLSSMRTKEWQSGVSTGVSGVCMLPA